MRWREDCRGACPPVVLQVLVAVKVLATVHAGQDGAVAALLFIVLLHLVLLDAVATRVAGEDHHLRVHVLASRSLGKSTHAVGQMAIGISDTVVHICMPWHPTGLTCTGRFAKRASKRKPQKKTEKNKKCTERKKVRKTARVSGAYQETRQAHGPLAIGGRRGQIAADDDD